MKIKVNNVCVDLTKDNIKEFRFSKKKNVNWPSFIKKKLSEKGLVFQKRILDESAVFFQRRILAERASFL